MKEFNTSKWSQEDFRELVSIFEQVCKRMIKEAGLSSYRAAKIINYNTDDDTYNLELPNGGILERRKSNLPSGVTLSEGDSVELDCKGGNLSNSWIALKHSKSN